MTDNAGTQYRRLGVLDIGSNSVRFVIYELFGAAFTSVYNEKVLAGLGRDLRSTGRLSESGRGEALAAIKRFTLLARAQNLDRILVGATAALRVATDAKEFIASIEAETGLDISPVSGKEEARLTALGLVAADPRANGIAADLGGASLELIHVSGGDVKSGVSFPIGPFQIIGRDLSDASSQNEAVIREKINTALDSQPLPQSPNAPLYLIGGAWRNLAGIHQARHLYPLRTLQAYSLMPGAAKDLAQWAWGAGRFDVMSWQDISKRRAETLPYGGLLLDILLERLNPPEIIISTAGLREGLVYDALGETLRRRDALLDGCRDLARGSLQGLHLADPLYHFLEPLDDILPAAFEPENESRLRRAACHLAGIGKGLHPDYRASLVFDSVLYAPLAGLTHKERAYLALILYHSYTSSQKFPNPSAINLLLSIKEREAARIYGAAIRVGVVACGRSPDLLKTLQVGLGENKIEIVAAASYEGLLTERVNYRLNKLCQLLGRGKT